MYFQIDNDQSVGKQSRQPIKIKKGIAIKREWRGGKVVGRGGGRGETRLPGFFVDRLTSEIQLYTCIDSINMNINKDDEIYAYKYYT